MKKIISLAIVALTVLVARAQTADSVSLAEVVVTGTRNAADVRHLPMTVTVIQREALTEQHQTSILPTVMQQVPGLFVTSRSMIGYGVSTGAAGSINLAVVMHLHDLHVKARRRQDRRDLLQDLGQGIDAKGHIRGSKNRCML